ncbi:NYN domain-containing protein [Nocardia sp. NPDC004654]|uniref:NYN domain-containing protein n=1 Tax=Nocardia sp. NPDC004654 TaxID=3154776 RepID=UPI0033ADBAEE
MDSEDNRESTRRAASVRTVAGRLLVTMGKRLLSDPVPGRDVGTAQISPVLHGRGEVAVLIDADNAPPSRIGAVLEAVDRYGTAHLKRAYGDWSQPHLSGWRAPLLAHSIRPIHNPSWTTGKNATDLAMAVDAIDLLHTGNYAAFVLVTSDADFTGLAMRLRESGRRVYGFGEAKTPKPLVTACDEFTNINTLTPSTSNPTPAASEPPAASTPDPTPLDTTVIAVLRAAVDHAADGDGWAHLGAVGNVLKIQHGITPKAYGRRKFGNFVKASGLFDVQTRSPGNGKSKVTYIRNKPTPRHPAAAGPHRLDGSDQSNTVGSAGSTQC